MGSSACYSQDHLTESSRRKIKKKKLRSQLGDQWFHEVVASPVTCESGFAQSLSSNLFVLYINLIWLQCVTMHIASLMVIRSGSHTIQRHYHLKLRYLLCSQIINRNVLSYSVRSHWARSSGGVFSAGVAPGEQAPPHDVPTAFRAKGHEIASSAIIIDYAWL